MTKEEFIEKVNSCLTTCVEGINANHHCWFPLPNGHFLAFEAGKDDEKPTIVVTETPYVNLMGYPAGSWEKVTTFGFTTSIPRWVDNYVKFLEYTEDILWEK